MWYFPISEWRHWSNCMDAQAGLWLCCLQTLKTGFLAYVKCSGLFTCTKLHTYMSSIIELVHKKSARWTQWTLSNLNINSVSLYFALNSQLITPCSFLYTSKTLIRLDWFCGWSESLLVHISVWVMSCTGLHILVYVLFLYTHWWTFSGLFLNSGFWGWLSIESQPQNTELRTL